MTLPAFPAFETDPWYDYATGLHNAVSAVIDTAAANAPKSQTEALVKWTGSAWPSSRPTGYARVRWSAEGYTNSTQPSAAAVGDVWERPTT